MTNSLIMLACIAFFALRYYVKGVWKAFFGLLGFVSAYLVSLIAAPYLASVAGVSDLQGLLLFGGSALGVFLLTSGLVSFVPLQIFPSLKHTKLQHRLLGAGLGVVTGGIFALLVIWVVSFASSMLGLNKSGGTSEQDILGKFSSRVVSQAVHAGIGAIEKDKYRASATAAFLSAPHTFSKAFSELSESKVLHDLWSDGEAQFYMSEGDVDQLLGNESFQQFSQSPAVQKVLQDGRPEDVSVDDAERYLATQLSYVWRRMKDLRSDQRVVEILNDPEVKDLVARQNPVAMLANSKVQELVEIVMEAPVDDVIPTVNFSEKTVPKIQDVQVEEIKSNIIYKWRDANGKMRYTDFHHTPESERATAEKVVR